MSRPRKPFGSSRRGRLPSTMIRVLAAEMSDPQRHRRGKRYAADGSVLDITIEPGIVTCEVQGSRPTPYIASLLVRQGDGMPLRRDVDARCSCPDDDNFDGYACKHVIASMYTLSDELMIEPELLDLWRDTSPRDTDSDDDARDDDDDDDDDARDDDEDDEDARDDDDDDVEDGRRGSANHVRGRAGTGRRRRHLTLVADRSTAGADDEDGEPPEEPASYDALGDHLAEPADATLPPLPALEPFDQPAPGRPELAAVLRDALAHVRVEWD